MIDIIKPYPGEDEFSTLKRKVYFTKEIKGRLEYAEKLIKMYLPNGIPITPEEKEEIDEFWSQYMTPDMRDLLIDYRFYNVFKNVKKDGQRLCYYLPDSFYNTFVDEYFANPQHSGPCNDKNLYDLYFDGANKPKTVFRKVYGMYMDDKYKEISLKDAIKRSRDAGEVILKITKFSSGGHGVMFWNPYVDGEDKLVDFLNNSNHIVCQEVIRQHPELSILNPTSINTIRMLTFFFDNKVYMLSSFIRFGAKGSRVDNIHSGGYACGIDENGRLRETACDIAGTIIDHRPQGKRLNEIQIPNYDRCVELVTDLSRRLFCMSRLLAWDIAIDEKGDPIVIEYSPSYSGSNYHQLCNGPIFGDMTEDVLKEVFSKSYTLNSIIKSFKS